MDDGHLPPVALSGEPGSGKTSVSERLAHALGARRISTGEAQRRIAAQRGISTLELNRLSESDPTIDVEIDSVFRALASVREALVVDSRLAWHFLPGAFKAHLIVDPTEAARRVLGRTGASAEHYRSLEEAEALIAGRAESEQRRFLSKYGVDIFRLDNYDLVIDSTRATPDEVAAAIVAHLTGPADGGAPPKTRPVILVTPARLVPPAGTAAPGDELARTTPGPPASAREQAGQSGLAGFPPIIVEYSRPHFRVVGDYGPVASAVSAGLPLVPVLLVR